VSDENELFVCFRLSKQNDLKYTLTVWRIVSVLVAENSHVVETLWMVTTSAIPMRWQRRVPPPSATRESESSDKEGVPFYDLGPSLQNLSHALGSLGEEGVYSNLEYSILDCWKNTNQSSWTNGT
jgi:hypothetical protein